MALAILALAGWSHAAAQEQPTPTVSASDSPGTMTVQFRPKKSFQFDIWVDGRRIGYTPVAMKLPEGQHLVTAVHLDLVPVLYVVEVVHVPGRQQTELLDTVLLKQSLLAAAHERIAKGLEVLGANPQVVFPAAMITQDTRDFARLLLMLDEESRRHPLLALREARLALADQRVEDARKLVDYAIKEAPTLASAWQMRSRLLLEADKVEEAIRAADRAVALEPENPVHFLTRAGAYLAAGEAYSARLDFERVLDLDPKSAEAMLGLQALQRSETP